jgi:hypothetical protein
METLSFSTIESSRRFCDTVKKSGWSPAVAVSAPLGGLLVGSLSLGWERNKRAEKKILLDQLSTEACQLQCWYYPKASFNIPRHQMRLSEEAIDDLRRMRTPADAEIFLRNYNSHVSTGRFHVGAVLLKGVTIEAKSAIKLETLLETAATNPNGGVKFGCMGFHAGVKVMHMREAAPSSSERITNQRVTMGTVVIALGPQTTDESEFKTKSEDRSYWYVIDHDEGATLVPVWEIAPFGDFEDLQKPRNMLREAWQRSVESEARTNARLHELLVSSYDTRSTRLNKLISPPVNKDEALAVPPYNVDHKTEYTYNGDVLVDRPLKGFEHTHGRMMDCLRHRMEPFESTRLNQPTSSNSEPDDGEDFFASSNAGNYDNECDKFGVTTNDGAPDSLGPVEILVELLISSDLLAQIALFQLLLEQRFSVPLVVPHVNTYYIPPETHPNFVKGFSHLVEALNFVQVKLANQEILSIGEDRNLPRVVFVSNTDDPSRRESADMASEIVNCHFVSKYSKSDIGDGPIAELGVGFWAKPNDQILKHMPCLVLCVWGPHSRLEKFLQKFADIVIVETEPDQKPRVLRWSGGHHDVADVLYWNINSTKRYRNNKENVQHMCGSFKDLTDDIAKFLMFKLKSFKGRSGGGKTLEECLSQIRPLNQQTSISNVTDIEATQLEGVRDSLKLQKSFATEAHTHVELLRQSGHKVDFVHKKTTPEVANDQLKLPILQLFIGLLSEHQRVKRQIGIVHFQLSIDKKLQSSLKKATDKVNVAFEKFQKNLGDSQLKDKYRIAKQEHVDRMLGLEHLWRELSHISPQTPPRSKSQGWLLTTCWMASHLKFWMEMQPCFTSCGWTQS